MISNERYPSMKDSNTAWLGDIPADWRLTKIGSLYDLRSEKVSDKDYPPLSVTMKGIVPQLSSAAKTDDGDNRKLVRIGDFAINSRSDRRGSCGISPYDGSVSLINTVLTPKEKMNPSYYDWLFHTSYFSDEFYRWGHGIVADLWTTRWQEMKKIVVPVPPSDVQELIAAFLDDQCGQIDALIEEAKASIEEYKAWKASIICEAVTKGLNPDAEMKDGGVQWIDKLPSDWRIVPLKSEFSFGKGLPITKADLVSDGIPVISYGQIHSKANPGTRIVKELLRYVPDKYLESNPSSLAKKGDIFIADTSEDHAGLGNAVHIDTDDTIFAGYHTIIARPVRPENSKYLSYLFLADNWRRQLRIMASGIKVFSVTQAMLRKVSILLPPPAEQEQICVFLDGKCSNIDWIIAEKQALISDLDSYKRSLIYESVTGKRKVV